MTDQPPSAPRGRHRTSSPSSRTFIVVGVVVALVAAAGVLTWLVRSGSSDAPSAASATGAGATADGSGEETISPAATSGSAAGGSDCGLPGGALTVAAAPDIAPTLATIVAQQNLTAAGCPLRIEPVDPTRLVDGSADASVWIPDSSIWLARAAAAGRTVDEVAPSIATSPVVLALSEQARQQLAAAGVPQDVAGILATRKTAAPIRVGLPDPEKSAAAVAAVLAARSSVTGASDARAALTWAVRSSPADLPVSGDELLARLPADPGTAVPVTEQALAAYNQENAARPAHAVYPGQGGFALDYPVVALAAAPEVTAAARDLAMALTSAQARTALQSSGFRAPDQSAGPALTATNGVDPAHRESSEPPTVDAVDEAIRNVQTTNEASRMLAVIDISGSMLAWCPARRREQDRPGQGCGGPRVGPVPGRQRHRPVGVLPTLTPTSDHRELIPISSLGADGQGGHRRRPAGPARSTGCRPSPTAEPDCTTPCWTPPGGARRVGPEPGECGADADRRDERRRQQHQLDAAAEHAGRRAGPNRPVPVISIAFGPDSDVNRWARSAGRPAARPTCRRTRGRSARSSWTPSANGCAGRAADRAEAVLPRDRVR